MTDMFYWQALNRAMDAEMAVDESVITLGEDVGLYGRTYRVTEGLMAKYGEWRVRDTPISENSFTGLGVGAAMLGLRPVVEIMTINFALFAIDAIINMAAKIPFMSGGQFPMPLIIRMPGGIARQLGAVDEEAVAPPIHQALLRRHGRDITCIAYSRMVILALEAADKLAAEGIEMTVIDLRSLSPIDWDTCVQSVKQTHHCLVVEEDCRFAGAGAELSATLQERCFYFLDRPVQSVAGLDIPTPFNGKLEAASIPSTEEIISAVRQMLGTQGGQS